MSSVAIVAIVAMLLAFLCVNYPSADLPGPAEVILTVKPDTVYVTPPYMPDRNPNRA